MKKGFSLIELLVVIAIIAVLSTIGLASFQNTARGGRDGKRKGDLSQIRAALELYRSQTGAYPAGPITAALPTMRTAGYISDPLPQDPKNATTPYIYTVSGNGYFLCASVEVQSNGNSTSTSSITNTTPSAYYCVTQP